MLTLRIIWAFFWKYHSMDRQLHYEQLLQLASHLRFVRVTTDAVAP
jgi:hypothetical protein